jgi:hypothetical protein
MKIVITRNADQFDVRIINDRDLTTRKFTYSCCANADVAIARAIAKAENAFMVFLPQRTMVIPVGAV